MRALRLAFRNVSRNRRRSAVTVLIAAVGTGAILMGGGFALYTYESLREAAARESGHLLVAHRDHFDGDEEVPLAHGLEDWRAVESELESSPGVRTVLPRIELTGLISNGEKSSVFVGTGVDAAGEFRVRGPFLQVLAGSVLAPRAGPGDSPEVMLGKDLARQLHAAPGDVLTLLATTTEGTLNAQDVRVKGVFTVGIRDLDERIVLVHLATAQRLLLTDKTSTLSVYLHETDDTAAARERVARAHPEKAVLTWLDRARYYAAVRGLYDRVFGLLGGIVVTMVLFAVANTLGMAVVERTREIGTLRAMGALPREIMRDFALEGLVVGGGGALLGILLAAGAAVVVDLTGLRMPAPPGWSAGYPLHIEVSLALCAATAAVIVLCSTGAAWLVSHKAARKPIAEALTHV